MNKPEPVILNINTQKSFLPIRVSHLFFLILFFDLARSIYSTKFYQEVDYHCYMTFGELFNSGIRDYSLFECNYGFMYYPAFFVYIYAAIFSLSKGSILFGFFIHISVQLLCTFFSLRIFFPLLSKSKTQSDSFLALPWKDYSIATPAHYLYLLYPIIYQTPYRAGLSRLTNDHIQSLFLILMIFFILNNSFLYASTCYTLALGFKMNALLWGPSLALVYLHKMSFPKVVKHGIYMLSLQLLLPLPFLLENSKTYVSIAFNFSRLFDPRRNLAWSFFGDDIRQTKEFGTIVLLLTLFFLFSSLFISHLRLLKSKNNKNIVFALIFPVFCCYTFSRGIHMQFFFWISFFLPHLIVKEAKFHPILAFLLIFTIDWAHQWTSNIISMSELQGQQLQMIPYHNLTVDYRFYQAHTFGFPGALVHNSSFTGLPIKLLGSYYPNGFSYMIIPSSFLLFLSEIIIILACFSNSHNYFILKSNKQNSSP